MLKKIIVDGRVVNFMISREDRYWCFYSRFFGGVARVGS